MYGKMRIRQTAERAPGNRSLTIDADEEPRLDEGIIGITRPFSAEQLENQIANNDLYDVLPHLPDEFVDLLFLDPPYNLTRSFRSSTFRSRPIGEYGSWFHSWFEPLLRTLKKEASVYVCCDWRCSDIVRSVLEKHLIIRNRITWEREKGRGALGNWKNCSEDIWYCTVSDEYTFNLDDVKLRRRVIAPYRESGGRPRGWQDDDQGKTRLTHPSNLWTDLTVPFWSMPENTEHPTQKPEKLLARIILASTRKGGLVFDPFLGSGTTSAVAAKLGRKYLGIEKDRHYCRLAGKRLEQAALNRSIQGYFDGVFWERNSRPQIAHQKSIRSG